MTGRPVFGPVWLLLWVAWLGPSWLLPNHYPPWSSFHVEAWASLCLLMSCVVVLWQSRTRMPIDAVGAVFIVIAFTPWVQVLTGALPFTGQAWLTMVYLGGFGLVMACAKQWELMTPNQPANALFIAIVGAGLVSVGLQLDQWGKLALSEIWSMGGPGTRPYANLGQPNMLSTLLIWGVLGVLWGGVRRHIGPTVALLATAFLLFGVALTQSRTGWLCLVVVFVAIWYWRGRWSWKRMPIVASALAIYFVACVQGMAWLSSMLDASTQLDMQQRLSMAGELRLSAWKHLLDSSFQRPWMGYGWNNISVAMLNVSNAQVPLHQPFGHAHNLLLDLVIGIGWPLGLALFAILARWVFMRARGIESAEEVPLLLMVVVVGIHAMLELPLHYLNFLLPTGVFMGILNARQMVPNVASIPRSALWGLFAGAMLLFVLVIRDYFAIELYYERLRFQWAKVEGRAPLGEPPRTLILTQLEGLVRVATYTPKERADPREIEGLGDVARTYVGAGNFYVYAMTLALNDRPKEAQEWLEKMCRNIEKTACENSWHAWQYDAKSNAKMAIVKWSVQ